MIFPLDVHRKVSETRKLVGQDRTAVLIQLFLFANVACFFLLRFIFTGLLGIGTRWAVLAQIVLFVFIGVLLFRFVIFKEDEKVREYKGFESDSFTKFLFIRKDSESYVDIKRDKVSVFEYANGTTTCVINFKFGSNDDIKSKYTQEVLDNIYGLIANYGFESRVICTPENFKNSLEFKRHINAINNVEDKTLAKVLRDVSNAVIETSNEESNVDEIYLIIRTSANYQKYELEGLLKGIMKVLLENITAFRSVSFLDMAELLEFYRQFYTVEAIDVTMMRALDLAEEIDDDYKKIVELYSLVATDGKRYKVNRNDEIQFVTRERSLT